MYRRFGKRWLDLFLTTIALIILWPVMLILVVLVRVKLGRPVLFRQQRPGFMERPFTLLKFRTMTDARDVDGQLLPDDVRLTPFGRFLRSTSLDELPELFSVLKNEMSLVGPRPLLMKYLPYYTDVEKKRFLIKPGITGWAQINGRNNASWEERLAFDVWYVDKLCLSLDIKILVLTIWQVIKREDIQILPRSTMLDLDDERKMIDGSPKY